MIPLSTMLGEIWNDYCALNPDARKIFDLLSARETSIENDHIALRTFDFPQINLEVMADVFKAYGYEEKGTYHFAEKKLEAKHYEHPDGIQPKIFISELTTRKLGEEVEATLRALIDQVPSSFYKDPRWILKGRPWSIDQKTYDDLAKVSEYASWVAAHGFRPNHFTVNVNALKSFSSLEDVNQYLKSQGFRLNQSGGEIKGTKDVYLEQSSTMAGEIEVSFKDGPKKIPACYYEFARRYPLPTGEIYQGFVTNSADRIFESTDRLK